MNYTIQNVLGSEKQKDSKNYTLPSPNNTAGMQLTKS